MENERTNALDESVVLAEKNNFVRLCGVVCDKAEDGCSEVHCTVEEKYFNPSGTGHGGFIATILDTASGIAVRSKSKGRKSMTMSASIYYLRAAKPGLVRAKAEVIKAGSKTALVEASLYDENGLLLAKGNFEFCYIN